ncbi:hypothetical protein WA158_007871 [Blastocystis sp. Blastoise]
MSVNGNSTRLDPKCGTIKSIKLENFMCHKSLYVKFSPDINFITGANGSGKSAVLAGIQTVLGVQSNSKREKKASNYIRHGWDGSAVVELEIWNTGYGAYQHDIYGDILIIERIISRTSSRYKIKSASGEVISTRKQDITKYLQYSHLQPDNPLVILDQESAKQFLYGEEKDRYEFMMKAVELTTVEDIYMSGHKGIEEMSRLNENFKNSELLELQRIYESKEETFKKHEELLRAPIYEEQKKKLIEWAKIQQVEIDIRLKEEKLSNDQKAIDSLKVNLDKLTEEYNNAMSKNEQISIQLKSLHEDVDNLNHEYNDKNREKQSIMGPINELKNRIRSCQFEINKEKKNEDRNRKQAEICFKKAKEQSEKEDIIHLIEKYQSQKTELLNRKQEKEKERQELRNEQLVLRRNVDDFNQTQNEYKRQLKQLQNELNDISTAIKNYVVRLSSEIEDRIKSFKIKPIGPIGQYIKIKPEYKNWSFAVETIIGRGLRSFICFDGNDMLLLNQIKKNLNIRNVQCYTKNSSCDYFDYSAYRPNSQFLCAMDVLDISHPAVQNIILDLNNLDQYSLVQTREEADHYMENGNHYSMPQNIRFFLLPDGDRTFATCGSLTNQPFQGRIQKLLESSQENRIEEYKQEYILQQKKIEQLNSEMMTSRQSQTNSGSQMRELEKQIGQIEKEIDTIEQKLSEINNMISSLQEKEKENDYLLDSQNYTNEAEENHKHISELETSLESIQKELSIKNELYVNINNELSNLRNKIQVTQDSIDQMGTQSEDLKKSIVIDGQRKLLNDKINNLVLKINDDSLNIQNTKETVQRAIDSAGGEETRPKKQLNLNRCVADLSRFQEKIKSQLTQLGTDSIETLKDDYIRSKTQYEESKRKYEDSYQAQQEMVLLDERHRKRLKEIRNKCYIDLRRTFKEILAERGYEGDLDIQKGEQKMAISISTSDTQSDGSHVKNLKILSGGERSNVCLCLISAMSRLMKTPVMILDEFDVFMDEANRTLAFTTMLHNAEEKRRQYIFITPHSLQPVLQKMGKFDIPIQTFRMEDPSRVSNFNNDTNNNNNENEEEEGDGDANEE